MRVGLEAHRGEQVLKNLGLWLALLKAREELPVEGLRWKQLLSGSSSVNSSRGSISTGSALISHRSAKRGEVTRVWTQEAKHVPTARLREQGRARRSRVTPGRRASSAVTFHLSRPTYRLVRIRGGWSHEEPTESTQSGSRRRAGRARNEGGRFRVLAAASAEETETPSAAWKCGDRPGQRATPSAVGGGGKFQRLPSERITLKVSPAETSRSCSPGRACAADCLV